MWPLSSGTGRRVQRRKGSTPTPRGFSSARWWLREKVLRPSSLTRVISSAIGRHYVSQGNYADAEALDQARQLVIEEKALGEAIPMRRHLNDLAILLPAAAIVKRHSPVARGDSFGYRRYAADDQLTGGQHKEGGAGGLVEQRADYLVRHVASFRRRRGSGSSPRRTRPRSSRHRAMGETAPRPAAAVQQMGLRFAAGTYALAALVRERQDLSAFWRDREKGLVPALSQPQGSTSIVIDRLRRELTGPRAGYRQHGAARTGVPALRGAGEPEAAHRGGVAAIAWRR